MITIKQLLESVNLHFEPGWVTQDYNGRVAIWETKPKLHSDSLAWCQGIYGAAFYTGLKLSEFDGKNWTECIYEVPQNDKPVVKIEKLNLSKDSCLILWGKKINELIEAVNELNGVNNET